MGASASSPSSSSLSVPIPTVRQLLSATRFRPARPSWAFPSMPSLWALAICAKEHQCQRRGMAPCSSRGETSATGRRRGRRPGDWTTGNNSWMLLLLLILYPPLHRVLRLKSETDGPLALRSLDSMVLAPYTLFVASTTAWKPGSPRYFQFRPAMGTRNPQGRRT